MNFHKPPFITVFFFFILNHAFSQETIKGTVYEQQSRETLIGANVIIPNTGKGTMTDFDGFFQMQVESLPVVIEVSFIGFEKKTINVESSNAIDSSIEVRDMKARHCSFILTIGLLGESTIEEVICSLTIMYSLSKSIISFEHPGFL